MKSKLRVVVIMGLLLIIGHEAQTQTMCEFTGVVTVCDGAGPFLAGATIQLNPGGYTATSSLGSPNFSLTVPCGIYEVTCSKAEFGSSTTTLDLSNPPGKRVVLSLVPNVCFKLTGTVISGVGSGQPLPNVVVGLPNSPRYPGANGGYIVLTDANGRFSMCAPPGTYQIQASNNHNWTLMDLVMDRDKNIVLTLP